MNRIRFDLAALFLAVTVSACGGGSVTEPEARAPRSPGYGIGMVGSGGYVDDGTEETGGYSATTADSTTTARGIGMAGSGY